MKRVIKFPLIMNDGNEVRTIDELRENFSLEKVAEYYIEGKLKTWLQHRNYIKELSQLEKLDCCDDINKIPLMLCKIFNVEKSIDLNVSEIERKNNKLSILKSFSDDEKWEKKLEFIAFTQDELEEKLIKGKLNNVLENNSHKLCREIYLCGEAFTVSNKFKDISYIGVNTPVVNIISSNGKLFDAKANNINFVNVKITSYTMIEAVITDSGNCIIDDTKILTRKMWDREPTIIDGKSYDKVLVYKNKLIGIGSNFSLKSEFEIIDIENGCTLKSMNDLKFIFLEDRDPEIYASSLEIQFCAITIYKDTLVCLCTESSVHKDTRIVLLNLETLKIDKFYIITEVNNFYNRLDNLCVYNNRIFVWAGSKYFSYDYNTGKYLDSNVSNSKGQEPFNLLNSIPDINRDGIPSVQFYEGNRYEFLPRHAKMITDNKAYCFKGFKKIGTKEREYSLNETGKIGVFDIFDGKIITTCCYVANQYGVKIAYDSVINDDGYILMYDTNGGDVIKVKKISNSIIRAIRYYKGNILVISDDREVIVLDAEKFLVLNTFKLQQESKLEEDDFNKLIDSINVKMSNTFGYFSSRFDIYIDESSDTLSVYDGEKIYLYK